MEVTEIAAGSDYVHIGLSGRMDAAGVEKQEARVYALFVPRGLHAVLDLSNVTFLASMGIRVLIMAAKTAKSKRARAAVVAPKGPVRDAIDTAAISGFVFIADDVASALDWIRSDPQAARG